MTLEQEFIIFSICKDIERTIRLKRNIKLFLEM
jgi:hypothetical protein